MSAWRHLSLWMNQLDDPLEARPSLEESLEVDVAIVGAGYTGLWTAYYLKRRAPQLRVAIVEAETAGFGASGRNGGWLMGNLLGEDGLLAGKMAAIECAAGAAPGRLRPAARDSRRSRAGAARGRHRLRLPQGRRALLRGALPGTGTPPARLSA